MRTTSGFQDGWSSGIRTWRRLILVHRLDEKLEWKTPSHLDGSLCDSTLRGPTALTGKGGTEHAAAEDVLRAMLGD